MKPFLDEEFLLQSETARQIYHQFAENEPIFDYHCHLPIKDIYENVQFQNITQAWLYGDHYKWRAMRANGIQEYKITGNASDYEKFCAWAETVPFTIGNPLFHWTHLELKRYFNINNITLSPSTAEEIYQKTQKILTSGAFNVRNLLNQMNVSVICTTDDPTDDLKYHQLLKADTKFKMTILPAFRPDKALAVDNAPIFYPWFKILEQIEGKKLSSFQDFIMALDHRHQFFHEVGCRISDHGLEIPYSITYSDDEIESIYQKIVNNSEWTHEELMKYRSAMMFEFGKMNAKRNWVMQLHLGAIRNNNTKMFETIGPDTGFDSIGDYNIAKPLSSFFDHLVKTDNLPKMIVYSVNPKDNDVLAAMIGNFQDGSSPGKLQLGSAWWFNDQKDGIEKQLISLANHGLLSRFVGMLTDSRSFMSYPRHEYFRRILCNILGNWVENGEIPNDFTLLGKIIQDICYNNAKNYFNLEIK